jgi:hypothetical protein
MFQKLKLKNEIVLEIGIELMYDGLGKFYGRKKD